MPVVVIGALILGAIGILIGGGEDLEGCNILTRILMVIIATPVGLLGGWLANVIRPDMMIADSNLTLVFKRFLYAVVIPFFATSFAFGYTCMAVKFGISSFFGE